MRNFSNRAAATVLGAMALGGIGIGSAAAADVTVPQYGESREYYGEPPTEERYVYGRPQAVYPAPPPVAYYEYEPRPVVVVPPPYFVRRPYVYGGRPYAFRRGPYFARGYGRYGGHRW
jgi:hypothetical protein